VQAAIGRASAEEQATPDALADQHGGLPRPTTAIARIRSSSKDATAGSIFDRKKPCPAAAEGCTASSNQPGMEYDAEVIARLGRQPLRQ
jgi:hypothetical protein